MGETILVVGAVGRFAGLVFPKLARGGADTHTSLRRHVAGTLFDSSAPV